MFTSVATVITFIFSTLYKDVSIYDPYWSVAPLVMIVINMVKYHLWNINSIIILIVVFIWSCRLTGNWFITYKGLGYEDWRYAKYRNQCQPLVFQLISFFGLHFVPTIVVYFALLSSLISIQNESFNILSIIGVVISLSGVMLEIMADQAIHKFLEEHQGERKTCNISVWRFSRHPNYLGEITFWVGLNIYFIALNPSIWYYASGVILVILLFLFISIPLMEKHNMERRVDYNEYKDKTSMLLLLPNKKNK